MIVSGDWYDRLASIESSLRNINSVNGRQIFNVSTSAFLRSAASLQLTYDVHISQTVVAMRTSHKWYKN